MSEANAAQVTETAAVAAPPPGPSAEDALAALLKMDDPAPKKPEPAPEAKPEPKTAKNGEPEHLAAANGRKPPKDPIDPLDPKDFEDEKLTTEEARKAAAVRIQKANRQALELTRAAHRAHAAGEERERKIKAREAAVVEREQRASIIERHQGEKQKALDDLETGDVDAFLQGVAKLKKTTDPVGFWKQATLAIAQGKPIPKQQQAQADANPELAARLERLEQHLQRGVAQSEEAQIEQLKDRNFEAAKGLQQFERVQVYASDPRTAPSIRHELSRIMMLAYEQDGQPIDIGEACRRLEANLAVHFELSQRADGKAQAGTNREKETASPGLDVGRETNTAPPKPETSQATIPAALSSAPASANRSMNEEEQRKLQIRQLESLGIFD